MRFSIKEMVLDVEDFQNKKYYYQKLLFKSQKDIPFYKFWENKVYQWEIDEAFRSYVNAMQKLERKYTNLFF